MIMHVVDLVTINFLPLILVLHLNTHCFIFYCIISFSVAMVLSETSFIKNNCHENIYILQFTIIHT